MPWLDRTGVVMNCWATWVYNVINRACMFGLRKENSMSFVLSARLLVVVVAFQATLTYSSVIVPDKLHNFDNSDESPRELGRFYYNPDQSEMNYNHANLQFPEMSQDLQSIPDLLQQKLYNIDWNNFFQKYNQLSPNYENEEIFTPDGYHLFTRPPSTQQLVKKIPEASVWANPIVSGDPNDLRKLRSYPNIFQIDRDAPTLSKGNRHRPDKSAEILRQVHRNTHFPEKYSLLHGKRNIQRRLPHYYTQPQDLNNFNNDLSSKLNMEDNFFRGGENSEEVNRKLKRLRALASLLTEAKIQRSSLNTIMSKYYPTNFAEQNVRTVYETCNFRMSFVVCKVYALIS
ncbi:hypothetical protein PHET_04048 [Paragonimus heterotremus]|uniref:Uncharacterized protein n=1 Tax=Paragonimus heterotremus TaxID=100268 RepID=A0A8J4TCG4_9TREM|nr:hypothetical protein PHET_04048 [Paragonimus heterotremus]